MQNYELKNEIRRLIADYPELAEDQDLLADMLEGETDFAKVADWLLDCEARAACFQDALAARINDLQHRKLRYARQQAEAKAALQDLLNAAGLKKIERPEGTASVSKGRERVIVSDLDALPQGYYVTTRKADLKAIKASFDAGETIPGAEVVRGDDYLTIRRG